MRLYKFLNAQFGLLAIKNRRLRISRLTELNDEFEFIGISLPLKAERNAMRRMRSRLSDESGLLCLSKDWGHPLLWGHYGDSYKGMALGFDVDERDFVEVDYVPKLPTLTALGYTSVAQLNFDNMQLLNRQKFDGWKYEGEYRCFTTLRDGEIIKGQMHYFFDFGPQLQLKEVIVGHRSKVTRQDVAEALGDLEPTVERFRARAAFDEFRIVRNHDETMWP